MYTVLKGDRCIGNIFKTLYTTLLNHFLNYISTKNYIQKERYGVDCSEHCIDGLYGHYCRNKCPSECNKTCDKANGVCTGQGQG